MKYQIFKQKFSEMEGLNLRIREAKQGFLFYAFSTLLIALQFGLYITDSSILEMMDLEGWLFFITSCISHAAMFALIPYLLSLIFTFCRCTKTARIVQIVGIVLLCIINYLNSQVYGMPLIFYGRNARRHTPGPSQDASSAAPSLPISAISMELSISSLP